MDQVKRHIIGAPLRRKFAWLIFTAVGLTLLALSLMSLRSLHKHASLGMYQNQACVGIGVALRNGIDLRKYDLDARTVDRSSGWQDVGQHKCATGTVVTQQAAGADGSGSASGYQLGADVVYFKTADAAYQYAEKVHNPTQSWGLDQEGQRNGIPQTSLFTFIHTDVPEPYFDAYTVRGNALMALSLPCTMTGQTDMAQSLNNCQVTAEKTLREFADTVQSNLSKNELF